MVDALGVTTPRSYKNIPFFMSTRGYGVFFNHSSLMTFWVGSLSAPPICRWRPRTTSSTTTSSWATSRRSSHATPT